jgi:hypothetical protein
MLLAATLLLAALTVAGCDDPLAPRRAPGMRAMSLFMILDPDRPTQPVLVAPVMESGFVDLRGEVLEGDRTVAAEPTDTAKVDEDWLPCADRYGSLVNSPSCLVFDFTPRYGATYRVAVSARDRPTAAATTTVPGNFAIVSHEAEGSPPGTTRLRATWTSSAGVYQYVVAVRGEGHIWCYPDSVCNERWYAVTQDTSLSVTIDAKYFKSAPGPYFLDVYAMNRDVFGYLMTGSTSGLFPVPPAQNVEGGAGGVGAWVKRAVPLR